MATRTTWKRLSARARAALAGEIEGALVMLSSPEELLPELLTWVADEGGGAVLIGIAEADGEGDAPSIVGCAVDGATRAELVEQAEACVPPLEVEVFVENEAATPFLRIEVPAGPLADADPALRFLADAVTELGGRVEDVGDELRALRGELSAVQRDLDTLAGVERERDGGRAKLQATVDDLVQRVRALARHLGADDKLVAWERRQLRSLLSTAVDLAARRGRGAASGGGGADPDEVVQQMRKTGARFYDWLRDEVMEPLQRDAQEMMAGLDEAAPDDADDQPDDDGDAED